MIKNILIILLEKIMMKYITKDFIENIARTHIQKHLQEQGYSKML
jgi:hypothetical protein